MPPSLNSLPPEIISRILCFLSNRDIVVLCQVCRYFHRWLNDPLWKTRGLQTNFRPDRFGSLKEACRVAHNWMYHKPKDITLKKFCKVRPTCQLYLDGPSLYISRDECILATKVNSSQHYFKEVFRCDALVQNYAVTESQVIAAGGKGILVWNKDSKKPIQDIPRGHRVKYLDACSTSVVAVSERHIVALGKDKNLFKYKYAANVNGTIEAVVINPDEGGVDVHCVGVGCYLSGVRCLQYQDPFTILSHGGICSLSCWDLRSSNKRDPAIIFPDEDLTFANCLDSDMNNFIACGFSSDGRIKFWDKRWPSKILQSIDLVGGRYTGMVPSLKITATRLYAILENNQQTLHFLNFKGKIC